MATAVTQPQKRQKCIHHRRRDRFAMKLCATMCVAAVLADNRHGSPESESLHEFRASPPESLVGGFCSQTA